METVKNAFPLRAALLSYVGITEKDYLQVSELGKRISSHPFVYINVDSTETVIQIHKGTPLL